MKRLKNTLIFGITLYYLIPLSVMAVTPEEVAAVGKEQSAAGVFIWFLCAIAFLKVSQKIDSFMASLGVNVGRTGGSMMAELMIAARGITSVKSLQGGSFSAVAPSRAVRYKTRLPFYPEDLWVPSAGILPRVLLIP